MKKIIYESTFFNIKDTLECGQIFRFIQHLKGYLVYSCDKCAYVYENLGNTVIECNDADEEYFYNYFDLARDYKSIYDSAINEKVDILTRSATAGKGVRILNQDKIEMLFSFIVSQNNNIPRIKGILNKLCTRLGDKKVYMGVEYFAFPNVEVMAKQDITFYQSIGLGYRAPYILKLAQNIVNGLNVEELDNLTTIELKDSLKKIHGVGPKVADCVALFGFHRSDSFPVDVWIEKVYKQDFGGELTDRKKIAQWFTDKFGYMSGYYQQYLFYYKREKEKSN